METTQEDEVQQNEAVGRCIFVLVMDKEKLNLSEIFLFCHTHPSTGCNKFSFLVTWSRMGRQEINVLLVMYLEQQDIL